MTKDMQVVFRLIERMLESGYWTIHAGEGMNRGLCLFENTDSGFISVWFNHYDIECLIVAGDVLGELNAIEGLSNNE